VLSRDRRKTQEMSDSKKKQIKNKGFNVPSKSNAPTATKWASYVFNMIKEAAPHLLEREDVKTAYNHFVDTLIQNSTNFRTTCPTGYEKYYSTYIKIKDYHSIPMYLDYRYNIQGVNESQRMKEKEAIFNSYIPLYELIKRDVIPYMDGKIHEMRKKRYTVIYHKRMEKIEKKIGGLQAAIKRLEKQEESERRQLGIYAQKIMDLDAPPELTKLD